MPSHRVVLIPGDGIGPSVADAVKKIFLAAHVDIDWQEHVAGVAALTKGRDVMPVETLEAVEHFKVALKGPCSTPVGEGFRSVNVALRKRLNLYAAVRPVRSLPGLETRFKDVDLIIIRENTEGLYSGVENEVVPGVVMSMKVATEVGCTRIAHWAFRFATRKRRRKITAMHKANIMKMTDGMFIRQAQQVHRTEYPNIEYDQMIIDAGCMKIVQDPTKFDILLLENLYGDVMSDLCAGLVGGLGVVPGANFGDHASIFEAVHGSAPDIVGKGIANPLALLMSGVMMLEHMGDEKDDDGLRTAAAKIRSAYERAIAEGQKTRDLGGELGTDAFTDAIIDRLNG
jgi:isocitrate dehydrogenase (NAD+)